MLDYRAMRTAKTFFSLAVALITLVVASCNEPAGPTATGNANSAANSNSASGQAEKAVPAVAPATPVASDAGSASPGASLPASSVKVAEVLKPAGKKPAKSPKIVLTSTKLDFGKQRQNTTINRSITVRNGGPVDLAIESVTPSCGCTTVDFPKVIHSGKSGRIAIKVETGTSPGPHTKQVTIKSNDPDQPTLIVQFTFDVKG
jgi:hypothetical protein